VPRLQVPGIIDAFVEKLPTSAAYRRMTMLYQQFPWGYFSMQLQGCGTAGLSH
jgi:hypothetical protein